MDTVVLSLGGSILVKDEDDPSYIRKLAKLLIGISLEHKLYIVTGGGKIARYYIRTGRDLGADEKCLDELGIEVTRLNARLLSVALGEHSCRTIPADYSEAEEKGKTHRIVVMGGVAPGITTDAVASYLAERVRAARLVNATSVDGAYTSDPKKDPKAKKIPRMSHKQLIELVKATPSGAGPTAVFDPTGAGVLAKAKIPLAIVNGRDLPSLRSALEGKEFEGTLVE
jgi:uridylate kinase